VALVGWILAFICLLGGLALRQDMPIGGSATLSTLLLLLALLACPALWRSLPRAPSRGQRIVLALILILSTPLLLLPPA